MTPNYEVRVTTRTNLSWRAALGSAALIVVVNLIIAAQGNEAFNTWGLYLYAFLGNSVVAGIMTTRTFRAHGWQPRVFLWTWWKWMWSLLALFAFFRLSPWAADYPWIANPDGPVAVTVRALVASSITTLFIVVLTKTEIVEELVDLSLVDKRRLPGDHGGGDSTGTATT
jgi:hypothetical protein